jgi:hypothetical protein
VNGKVYDFYENMLKISCFGTKNKCKDCDIATAKGHLECLECLECLKYSHENGCPWDSETCYFATKNGHVQMQRIMDI